MRWDVSQFSLGLDLQNKETKILGIHENDTTATYLCTKG